MVLRRILLILTFIFVLTSNASAQSGVPADPVLQAVAAGDVVAVKAALDKTPGADRGKDRRWTLLMEAAKHNQADVARLLIEKGADVNFVGRQGSTPLIVAAGHGSLDAAKLLVEKGANVNFQDHEKMSDPMDFDVENTALIAAVEHYRIEMIKFLLAHGAEVNRQESTGKTTLTLAVQGGSEDGSREMIELLSDPSVVDHNKPPLPTEIAVLFAYATGHKDVATMLIDRGLPVDTRSPRNYSALMAAAQNGDLEMAKLFVSKGADVNAATHAEAGWKPGPGEVYSFGWTPLMFAAAAQYTDVVRFLLEKGANPALKNSDGKTALDLADQQKFTDIVLLLKSKPSVPSGKPQ